MFDPDQPKNSISEDVVINIVSPDTLQGNVPLRHLLSEDTLFMSRRRSDNKEVSDWAHSLIEKKNEVIGQA